MPEKKDTIPCMYYINSLIDKTNDIDEKVFEKRLNRKFSIETRGLKGKVRFSIDAFKCILEYLVNMFNAEYILNNRCRFKNDIFLKKVFPQYLSIFVNSSYSFDYEGVTNEGKYLIKNGMIVDFLNNIKTYKIIGGTPGDVNTINIQNEFTIGVSDISVEINKYEDLYDIFVDEIDTQQTMFDLSTGIISMICYGYEKSHENCMYKYIKKVDIIDFVNRMKSYSQSIENDLFKVPEVVVSF